MFGTQIFNDFAKHRSTRHRGRYSFLCFRCRSILENMPLPNVLRIFLLFSLFFFFCERNGTQNGTVVGGENY